MSIHAALSVAVLVTLVGASSSVAQQSVPAVDAKTDGAPSAKSVTATGCLIQEPPLPGAPLAGHESASATGLALKKATVQPSESTSDVTVQRPSAVPGSSPSGRGSETTSPNSVASRPPAPASGDRSFWIGGKQRVELSRYVGKRVQVTGVLEQKSAFTPVSSGRTTPAPGVRQQTSDSTVAHPSAPVDTIDVQTFRVVEESCS